MINYILWAEQGQAENRHIQQHWTHTGEQYINIYKQTNNAIFTSLSQCWFQSTESFPKACSVWRSDEWVGELWLSILLSILSAIKKCVFKCPSLFISSSITYQCESGPISLSPETPHEKPADLWLSIEYEVRVVQYHIQMSNS